MLCWDYSERRWVERETLSLSRRDVLGRSIYVMIPQDMGVEPLRAVGIGRVAEAYGHGEDLVGKMMFYEIDLRAPVCRLCPAEPIHYTELREKWVRGPYASLIYEVGLAVSLSRRVGAGVLVLGESLSSVVAAMVAERAGVSVYTLRRKIPGVRTHILTIDSWSEERVRDFFLAGRLSEEERAFIEERLSTVKRGRVFYHPLLRGQKILLSLGGGLVLRSIPRPVVDSLTVSLAKRVFRVVGQRYMVVVRPGESVPRDVYTVIDFSGPPQTGGAQAAGPRSLNLSGS